MANMTLSVPKALHTRMKEHSDVKWSDVARQAFEDKLRRQELLNWMDEKLKNSTLTEKDVDEIGHSIKAGILKRLQSS